MSGVTTDLPRLLLQKNERVRERHGRLVKQLRQEESRADVQLSKRIEDLRVEIRDARAYDVVYKENNLSSIYKKREQSEASATKLDRTLYGINSLHMSDMKTVNMSAKAPAARANPDPFRLQSCLNDTDLGKSSHLKPDSAVESRSVPTARKRLRRVASVPTRRLGSKSLLPGNCTSYYSIRRYYEEEKEKVLVYWSPIERRKRVVQWIKSNINSVNSSPTAPSALSATTSGGYTQTSAALRIYNI